MKTNIEIPKSYEVINSAECEKTAGGFIIALQILGGMAAACTIAYYVGYAVGKFACENK
jgi:hypothetical protein